MNDKQIIDMANESGCFWDRLIFLKTEILENLIDLLVENNITELKLPTDPDEDGVVWFIWDDNDGDFHNSPVRYVSQENGKLEICIEDTTESFGTILDTTDLNHYHLGCLCNLLDTVRATLKDKQHGKN